MASRSFTIEPILTLLAAAPSPFLKQMRYIVNTIRE